MTRFRDVLKFHAQKPSVTFPLYWDIDQRMANALHANVLPTSIIVGKDGVQLQRFDGGIDWQHPEVEAMINQWLQ